MNRVYFIDTPFRHFQIRCSMTLMPLLANMPRRAPFASIVITLPPLRATGDRQPAALSQARRIDAYCSHQPRFSFVSRR